MRHQPLFVHNLYGCQLFRSCACAIYLGRLSLCGRAGIEATPAGAHGLGLLASIVFNNNHVDHFPLRVSRAKQKCSS